MALHLLIVQVSQSINYANVLFIIEIRKEALSCIIKLNENGVIEMHLHHACSSLKVFLEVVNLI